MNSRQFIKLIEELEEKFGRSFEMYFPVTDKELTVKYSAEFACIEFSEPTEVGGKPYRNIGFEGHEISLADALADGLDANLMDNDVED